MQFLSVNHSLDDSPLLDQRYKNPMCFIQRCNYAMHFIQPFHYPHSPSLQNVAQNTLKVYNVANSECISYNVAKDKTNSVTLHILHKFCATF